MALKHDLTNGVSLNADDYRRYSFWLESADDDLTPRQSLSGSVDVDVAILGAGFTGLWTAYYLLQQHPSLRVAIVEKEVAGFGASGRNGAWCTSESPVGLRQLTRRFGIDAARQFQLALFDTVDEVGRVVSHENLDAGFAKGGELLVARGPYHVPAIQDAYAEVLDLDLGNHFELLDGEHTRARVRIQGASAGLLGFETAVVHPGKLVRGLAQTVERLGGSIFERSEVRRVVTGPSPRLETRHGFVTAKTVVLAGEAYLSQLKIWKRRVIPLYSLIVLTEPLSQAQWQEVGWDHRECLASPRYTVDYLSRTPDGRILYGGRGAPYHFGSKIRDSYDHHAPTHRMLREQFLHWFPQLDGIRFTHAWGGPLGMPRDWLPTFMYSPHNGLAVAAGYTGQGVAMANLAGRTLTDLITHRETGRTSLPPVREPPPRWEPEPLRWLGIRMLQRQLMHLDNSAERTGRPPTGRSIAERLARH